MSHTACAMTAAGKWQPRYERGWSGITRLRVQGISNLAPHPYCDKAYAPPAAAESALATKSPNLGICLRPVGIRLRLSALGSGGHVIQIDRLVEGVFIQSGHAIQ